jgi:hypothetical protein
MSTALEQAWKTVSTTWQTDEFQARALADVLRGRIDRQTRRMRWVVAIEVAITVIVLHLVATVIIKSGGAGAVRLSALVLLYTGGIWAFALWNRRGTWSPYGEATADFVALLRVRAERRMKSARFCISVIAIAALLVGRQIEAAWRGGSMSAWDRGIWIGFSIYSVGLVAWGVWYLRRARRELQGLAAMERELDLNPEVNRVAP